MRDKFPTIRQLTTDPRFFPYRYGQALWAYIGGRWGDRAVVDVYRTSLRLGFEQALIRSLGLSADSLSKDWAAANKAFYAGQIAGRAHPDSAGKTIVAQKDKKGSEYNVGPALSADGRYLAFFTTKTNLFGIDLVLADANTGKIIRQLAGPQSDAHFDAISFLNSAGNFSPDGERFAFIVFADGDNEIVVVKTSNGDVVKKFRPADVGAIYNLAWSPNGQEIVFTGSKGGVADLYLANVETGAARQLTNDKYGDFNPTFSPDGRTIAFASDRGPATNFERLTFGEMQLATLDVATGNVTVQQGFAEGKHINPQFSADGGSLFFVSDQDGISDVYRLDLSSGQKFRITRLATGVSGVTASSPAITVAQRTGRLMFTIFRGQGHEIVALEPAQLVGTPVETSGIRVASAATLPPGDVAGNMTVATYLADASTGLVSGSEFTVVRYKPSFALDALGQPSVGVTTGGYYGTGLVGGISALFGDQLGDQQIFTAVQANGTVKDFGGAVFYQNLKRRLNWVAGAQHIPYLTGYQQVMPAANGNFIVRTLLQRIYVDQASLSAQYPLSQTKRFELGASGTHLGFEQMIEELLVNPVGLPLDRRFQDSAGPAPVTYMQANAAFVGDNSFSAFTSPISGTRYRFEVAPTFGTVVFNTGLADARRYFFKRPVTLAFRGMHYGRYGRDEDNYDLLSPLFIGEETLMRGYSYGSLSPGECVANNDPTSGRCPVFDRMLGSRIGVLNAELRIPFLGTSGFGLINFPYLPLEISPFFDAGIAYTGSQSPDFRFTREANDVPTNCMNEQTQQGIFKPCAERIPLFSTGVSFRFNLLGYMILETYVAKPFQRPAKSWVWGIQLAPGW
jgi:WD40 repeat protein